jgi:hypothetical protein
MARRASRRTFAAGMQTILEDPMSTSNRPRRSRRTLTGAAIAVALFIAAPATSSARPADDPHATPRGAVAVTATVPSTTAVRSLRPAGDGAGLLTVLLIAGGALLLGAATGFEGGRVLTRRGTLRS